LLSHAVVLREPIALPYPGRKRTRLAWLPMAAVLAFPAAAASADDYPRQLDPGSIEAWLRDLGIPAEQVVAVTRLAAVAIVSDKPARGARGEVTLRAEAISPEARARTGFLSWETKLSVDCAQRQVRLGPTTAYAGRIPDEDGMPLGAADTAWRPPAEGTAIESAWRAVCDSTFQPPLVAASARAATGPPAPGPRAPAPAPRKTEPAPVRQAASPAPPPPRAAAVDASVAAQVISSTLAQDSRRGLEALRRRFPDAFAGRSARIEPAQVRGRTVYRGLVAGFGSRRDAAAFCRLLKQNGQDCLVR
jgi:hypothetical protein